MPRASLLSLPDELLEQVFEEVAESVWRLVEPDEVATEVDAQAGEAVEGAGALRSLSADCSDPLSASIIAVDQLDGATVNKTSGAKWQWGWQWEDLLFTRGSWGNLTHFTRICRRLQNIALAKMPRRKLDFDTTRGFQSLARISEGVTSLRTPNPASITHLKLTTGDDSSCDECEKIRQGDDCDGFNLTHVRTLLELTVSLVDLELDTGCHRWHTHLIRPVPGNDQLPTTFFTDLKLPELLHVRIKHAYDGEELQGYDEDSDGEDDDAYGLAEQRREEREEMARLQKRAKAMQLNFDDIWESAPKIKKVSLPDIEVVFRGDGSGIAESIVSADPYDLYALESFADVYCCNQAITRLSLRDLRVPAMLWPYRIQRLEGRELRLGDAWGQKAYKWLSFAEKAEPHTFHYVEEVAISCLKIVDLLDLRLLCANFASLMRLVCHHLDVERDRRDFSEVWDEIVLALPSAIPTLRELQIARGSRKGCFCRPNIEDAFTAVCESGNVELTWAGCTLRH